MKRFTYGLVAVLAMALLMPSTAAYAADDDTYSQEEVLNKARGFFGETTKGLAKAVEKVFQEKGRPNAVITGEEASGAFGVGARYGKGELTKKGGAPIKVFWQGPSVGFDIGGNASKAFVLVYNLKSTDSIFQRFPGVDGSFYVIAGVGVNYLQSGDIILAPMRTGVGLRAGASIGYLHFTKEHSWIPF
ncbi:MAG: DUF1134 domain-containing protein [Rhodospirillales bacterium]